MGKLSLLRRLLAVRWFSGWVKSTLLNDVASDPHKPAVILFTSGSEKAPKAVPLTHANIISDQRGCLEALKLDRNNSALGFLPHVPQLRADHHRAVAAVRRACASSTTRTRPTPAALARKIGAYKPTLAAGTPTFMSYILDRAKPGDLDSLTLVVVGAEKCPPSLFEKAEATRPERGGDRRVRHHRVLAGGRGAAGRATRTPARSGRRCPASRCA